MGHGKDGSYDCPFVRCRVAPGRLGVRRYQDVPPQLRGIADDDRLVGSAQANSIYAEDGNDRVLRRGGEDALKGGDGRDEVHGQEGNDRVKGSAGMDGVYGGPGDGLVRGTPGSGRTTGHATSSTAAMAPTRPSS
jgi:Ca2+-binding RTX toxin-like protein